MIKKKNIRIAVKYQLHQLTGELFLHGKWTERQTNKQTYTYTQNKTKQLKQAHSKHEQCVITVMPYSYNTLEPEGT